MRTDLLQALAALNLHRNGEVFWLSYDAEPTDAELGIGDFTLAA